MAEDDVAALTDRLFPWLAAARADWTSFWVRLAEHTAAPVDDDAARTEAARLVPGAPDPAGLAAWLADWRAMGPDPARMRAVNPVYIPRNHLLDEALTAAEDGDLTAVHRLLEAVTDPLTPRPGFERHAEPGPADGAPFVTYCGT